MKHKNRPRSPCYLLQQNAYPWVSIGGFRWNKISFRVGPSWIVVILNNLPTPIYIRSYPHGMFQTEELNNCEQIIRQGSFIELFSLCNQLKIELCIFHGNMAPDNFWNQKGAKDIILNLQKNSAVYPLAIPKSWNHLFYPLAVRNTNSSQHGLHRLHSRSKSIFIQI